MGSHPWIKSAFGISQIVILVVAFFAIVTYWLKNRNRTSDVSMRLDARDLHATVQRTPVRSVKKTDESASPQASPQLESALPTWGPSTPAHEILGVHPAADVATIEKAYRDQLKRYHPDRFASWGSGYQARAHHVVLLLQKARDQMLVGKSTGR